MEQKMKILSKEKVEGNLVVVREMTETLTEQDILARKQNLEYMQADARKQVQQAQDRVLSLDTQIKDCEDLLATLTITE